MPNQAPKTGPQARAGVRRADGGETAPIVRLDNAGLKRGGRWLVRGVDLAVLPGEIVTLIGPNGSGKSTTARMVLGIEKPSEGVASRKRGLKVGYVPQKLSVDWTLPLTVERFMALTAPLEAARLEAALAETGIAHLKKAEVRHLSGGEFQRALLARAIAREPDLLVLDEPVQGVDFAGEVALYELISRVRDRLGCGVLLISHDLHVVMAATDSVICLNGHVCCRGTPEVVAESEEYHRLFGGQLFDGKVAGTLAVYRHHHDHTHLPDGRVRHGDGSVADEGHPGDSHAGDGHHAHEHEHAQGEGGDA